MFGCTLEEVTEEKDLGIIDNQLKFHAQTASVSNKSCRLLGLIKKSFANISKDRFLQFYTSLVRPCLEYANAIWGPFYTTDKNRLEAIQRKATKIVTTIRDLSYQQQLLALNLPSLEYRRFRGNMITVYNIFHDQYDM